MYPCSFQELFKHCITLRLPRIEESFNPLRNSPLALHEDQTHGKTSKVVIKIHTDRILFIDMYECGFFSPNLTNKIKLVNW